MRHSETHRPVPPEPDTNLHHAVRDLALETALAAFRKSAAEALGDSLPKFATLLGAGGLYVLERPDESWRFRRLRSWPDKLRSELHLTTQDLLSREGLSSLRRGKVLYYQRDGASGHFAEAGFNPTPFEAVAVTGLNSGERLAGLLVAGFAGSADWPEGLDTLLEIYAQCLAPLLERREVAGSPGLLSQALEATEDMVLLAEAAAESSGEPRIVYVNEAFVRATGYAKAEAAGEGLRLLHGPKTSEETVKRIYRALAAGQPARAELVHYRKDGSEFWAELELQPLRQNGGAPSHWLAVQRDATRRKAEETRLRRSEARFRSLVQHASGVITIVDSEQRIRYVSDSLRRELGYQPSEMLGTSALGLVHPDDLQAAEALLSRSRATVGALERGEFRLRHADGSWRWMAVVVQNMTDQPGVAGLVVNARDVSMQRSALRRLEVHQHDLGRAALVRDSLLEVVNDVLQRGIDADFYQRLLSRAIQAIPNAQAGSILLKSDDHYLMSAAVGYDLPALKNLRFTDAQLRHTVDLEGYSPKLTTKLASLNSEILGDEARRLLEQAGRTGEIAVTLSVPVMVGDTVKALLTVDNFESEDAFGVDAVETAALFASQVGLALQRLELQQEAELRARFRETLMEVANDALAEGIDQGFYQRLVERAVAVIPDADAGSILVKRPDGRFGFVAAVGFDLDALAEAWFEPGDLYASQHPEEATSLRFDTVGHHVGKVLDPSRQAVLERAGRVHDIRVALNVPIRLGGELVAVLSLDNMRSPAAFQGDSRGMAEAFGTQIRVVLQRLWHQEQVERRARFHQQLSEVVGESLEEGLDAGFYQRLLTRAIATVPGAEAGSILLKDAGGGFSFVAAQGFDLERLRRLRFEEAEVLAWHPDGRPLLVDSEVIQAETRDEHAAVLRDAGRLTEIKLRLAVPLALQGEILAILNLDSFSSGRAFDDEALEYAASFATQIGVVLQRLELQREAERRAKYQQTLARVEHLLLEFSSLDAFFKPLSEIILNTPELGARQVGLYRLQPDGTFTSEHFGVSEDVAKQTALALQERNMLELDKGQGLIALVAKQGQSHYVPDVAGEPHWVELGLADIRSIFLMPVFRQGKLWGVFDLVSPNRDAFSLAARELLAQVAKSIELALDKQAGREELQREYERLKIVSAAHARLLGARNLDEAYACAVDALVRDTPATSAHLLLHRQHGNALRVVAGAGSKPRRLEGAVLGRGGLAWRVFEARRSLRIPGAPRGQTAARPEADEPPTDFLGSPLQDDTGNIVGVLVALIEGEASFSPSDQSFVEAIAQACTSAIIRLHLLERSEKEAAAYRSLALFGATIEEINEADQLIDMGLRQLQEQLGFDCAHYHRLRGGLLEVVKATGYEADEFFELSKKQALPLGEGLVGRAALTGEPDYLPDCRVWDHKIPATGAHEVSTALAIPVRRSGQVVSVVAMHSVGAAHPLRKEQLSIARNFVKRLEHALERADTLREVSATRESTFRSLGVMLEYRDFETKGHTDRVVDLSVQLGRKLGFDGEQLRALRWGAYLHDIGKIAIPDQILLKPGKLDLNEFEIIRRHTVIGTEMCRNIPFLPTDTRQIVRSHHERWDGGGYPDALMGNEVPLMARIFALIDVYDALTSVRPYKEAWAKEAAVAEILAQAGRQFDPELVPLFVEMVMNRRDAER